MAMLLRSSLKAAGRAAPNKLLVARPTASILSSSQNHHTPTVGGSSTSFSRQGTWYHTSTFKPLSIRTNFDFVTAAPSTSSSTNNTNKAAHLPLVKIVATIGPTSEQEEPLRKVVQAGMTVMRLNFSHATREEVELRCTNLDKAQLTLNGTTASPLKQTTRAILLDTKGPEIRTGTLANDHSGHETISLQEGDVIFLHTDPKIRDDGSTASDIYVDYPSLHKCLKAGSQVLLDDGAVILTVSADPDATRVHGKVECVVQNSGTIRSRAGVNLPLADTSDLPALSPKDRTDIKYGMTMDIDFVAASFVQTAAGVREIRRYIQECAQELGWDKAQPLPKIISKIETAGALQHFDAILQESDGIMVARGDLGVEIPLSQVTCAQKQMVAACNAVGKPVIVATQMLESMSKAPRPTVRCRLKIPFPGSEPSLGKAPCVLKGTNEHTRRRSHALYCLLFARCSFFLVVCLLFVSLAQRAEVADVTNAVADGADAVMTSGETAKGKYPDETIQFMQEIIRNTEAYVRQEQEGSDSHKVDVSTSHLQDVFAASPKSRHSAIAKAAVTASKEQHCQAILVLTNQGTLPPLVAAFRPRVPILVFCPSSKIARQLQLHRAIHPIVSQVSSVSYAKKATHAMDQAVQLGYLDHGDNVVLVSMEDDQTADMKIATVR